MSILHSVVKYNHNDDKFRGAQVFKYINMNIQSLIDNLQNRNANEERRSKLIR